MEFVKEFQGLVIFLATTIVGSLGWMIRLEAKVKRNEQDVASLKELRVEDRQNEKEHRERLETTLRDIDHDVKAIRNMIIQYVSNDRSE